MSLASRGIIDVSSLYSLSSSSWNGGKLQNYSSEQLMMKKCEREYQSPGLGSVNSLNIC